MSLTTDVADKVIELGRATVDDLTKFFPGFAREQVKNALHNASYRGCIVAVEHGKRLGRSKGVSPHVYGPAAPSMPARPRISSVWDLGRQAEGVMP